MVAVLGNGAVDDGVSFGLDVDVGSGVLVDVEGGDGVLVDVEGGDGVLVAVAVDTGVVVEGRAVAVSSDVSAWRSAGVAVEVRILNDAGLPPPDPTAMDMVVGVAAGDGSASESWVITM